MNISSWLCPAGRMTSESGEEYTEEAGVEEKADDPGVEGPAPAAGEIAEEASPDKNTEKDKKAKSSDKKETEKKSKEKKAERSRSHRKSKKASRSRSHKKSKEKKAARSRSHRDRGRRRSRRRESGRDRATVRAAKKEGDKAIGHEAVDRTKPPPEPDQPPKLPGGSARPASKGKGKEGKPKRWVCRDCGGRTAPYESAMEQHRWSNEQCLTWQRWNQLSKAEQTKAAWEACGEYAQRLRLTRRTDAPEVAPATRSDSPLTVASSKGRGQKPAHATSQVVAASNAEKKKVKKHRERSEGSSSGATPVRRRRHRRRESSSSHGHRERREGRNRNHVVINIA